MEQQIVITGGHSGIGLELTRQLLEQPVKIGLVVRNKSRLEALPAEIRDSPKLTAWEADLSQQDDVVKVAEQIIADWGQVDMLFNNAGVLAGEFKLSPQKNEMQLEVNALAAYLLTIHLKPALDKAEAPLVVNTATGSMHSRALDLAEVTDPERFRKLVGAYMQSKLVLTLLMNDLAKQPGWEGVRIRSVNPGPNKTGMTRDAGMPALMAPIAKLLFPPPTKGASWLHKAAFDPQHGAASGVFLDKNRIRPVKSSLSAEEKQTLLAKITVPMAA